MSEYWHVILTIGIVLQLIVLMIKNEIDDFNPGMVFAPTILTIGLLILIPLFKDIINNPAGPGIAEYKEYSLWQKFMLGVAGLQALMIILRITISTDMPWYLVFFPLIVFTGLGLLILLVIPYFHGRHMEKTRPDGYG